MREREEFGPKPELLPQTFLKNLRAILLDGGYETRWIKLSQPSDSQEPEKFIDLGETLPSEIFPVWRHDIGWTDTLIFPEDRRLLISKNDKVYVFVAWMDILGGCGGYFPFASEDEYDDELADADQATEYLFNYEFYQLNRKSELREFLKKIDNEDLEPDLRITYWEDNLPFFDEQTKTGSLSCDPETYTEYSEVIVAVKESQEKDELFKKILTIIDG